MHKDKITAAYKQSKNIYDDVLTHKGFLAKAYIGIFWGVDDLLIAEKILSWIPDDFGGQLLDVPVGTGVFTDKKYQKMENASIVALDYSDDMLEKARVRFKDMDHVELVQGDVGNLNFADNYFDIVLSMNGFHVFPDKKKAFSEVFRVLKPNGKFIGCFYIKNEKWLTDVVVNLVLKKKGWFSPDQLTKDEVIAVLSEQYETVKVENKHAMIWFYCENKR
ncbi:MAG: SAM-dependent methyltransferase [Gammaproteobacteria bacterium]|nr:MAG: SAM-dependent methyltransferase [Gammaproteobacteria bacterium]